MQRHTHTQKPLLAVIHVFIWGYEHTSTCAYTHTQAHTLLAQQWSRLPIAESQIHLASALSLSPALFAACHAAPPPLCLLAARGETRSSFSLPLPSVFPSFFCLPYLSATRSPSVFIFASSLCLSAFLTVLTEQHLLCTQTTVHSQTLRVNRFIHLRCVHK